MFVSEILKELDHPVHTSIRSCVVLIVRQVAIDKAG